MSATQEAEDQADPDPDTATLDPAGSEPEGAAAGAVLNAERVHLRRSREFLRRMRDDVLSLEALAGDRVSHEYLKAGLYRRAEALRDLPGVPLFFGRLDYTGPPLERFHIGRRHVHDEQGHPMVIDWRAPVSRPFYRASRGDPMGVALRRRFGFSGGELTAYEDEDFAGGDGGVRGAGGVRGDGEMSRILVEEIERPRVGPMRDIVATIQPDQDDIVRADASHTVCVQGARLAVVPVTLAKGLEFDHVIVVEPARITGAGATGLRRLYVALTRAVSRLWVLHAEPLPAPLR